MDIFYKNSIEKQKLFSKNIILFILLSVFIHILFISITIYSFSRTNEIISADLAVVLGASVWGNNPSPVFKERINHGIWLYKNGYVHYLLFTGGTGKNSAVSESSAAKNYAIENLVPIENIFIEECSRITLQNILYAKEIIKEHNFNKIIIVSDPLHMKRSITMARDNNLNAYSSPTPTTRYISIKPKIKFLLYETFFYFIYEIYKYSFSIFLYTFLFLVLFSIRCFNTLRKNCA
jgi:uncharacterized SAM-binding protein YcdF (DUF218 family)